MATIATGSDTLQSAVQSFLQESKALFIGGRYEPARQGGTLTTIDPGSGRALAQIPAGTAEDVDAAVGEAARAFQRSAWAKISARERSVYLHRLADLVERDTEIIAGIESLDVGKPLPQARWDVGNFSQTMRYYADLAQHLRYREPIAVSKHEARTVLQPHGVCAFIFPWNFPFLLVGWGISPALAAGNTVVIKPAEDTPLSTLYLTRLVQEAGIPDGVVNVVTGFGETAGAALAAHPGISRMSFTGSPEVGRMVAEACGRNLVPVKLELGGKGAAIVFSDSDIQATAESLTRAVTLNSGQVCCTATRWVVEESVYDRFVECAIERMTSVKSGYGADPETDMGPVVSSKQMDRVLGYIDKGQKEGASALLAGGREEVRGYERGFYVKPALLAGKPDNIAAREEIFGPVAFVMKFRDESEAVDLVNQSRYGLANSVWSNDLERANRVSEALVAGNSWINAHNVFVHGVPYGGVNLSGLGGGVLGPDTLLDYFRRQSVVRPV
jgi:acyl-CoA reductase-like NAD-dependent aldehyde dehydrogenase